MPDLAEALVADEPVEDIEPVSLGDIAPFEEPVLIPVEPAPMEPELGDPAPPIAPAPIEPPVELMPPPLAPPAAPPAPPVDWAKAPELKATAATAAKM